LVRNPNKTYENTSIFRIIPKYIIQFGDIKNDDGTGHLSYFEDNRFINDEITKDITFCEPGVVALANKGPNTNGSQFFITTDEITNLNEKFTIIGQTIAGFEKLQKLSSICGSSDGTTNCNAKISSSGIYNYSEYMRNKKIKL
jgi:cyclophilin family peptidyl-prolyl cis-trans isomerase